MEIVYILAKTKALCIFAPDNEEKGRGPMVPFFFYQPI
jgi:hypothetical protein